MRKHKKETVAAAGLLGLIAVVAILFFVVPAVRFIVEDIYHSVFKIAITDRVLSDKGQIFSNISYCNTNNAHQTLDIFLPKTAEQKPSPLVIFIHGGGWRTGDKANRELSYYGESLLNNGIALASINYRLAPVDTYPAQNDDVTCALDYLARNASRYNIAPDKWGIFGDSAGAQLGAMATASPPSASHIAAFVGFYGPYDLSLQINRSPRNDRDALIYTNHGKDEDKASPLHVPANQHVAYLLFHGNNDRVVPYAQSQSFADKLRADNASVELIEVKNAGHYFSPRTTPNNKDIRTKVTEFYQSHIGL